MVASVDAVRWEPVVPEQLTTTTVPGDRDSLFAVEWRGPSRSCPRPPETTATSSYCLHPSADGAGRPVPDRVRAVTHQVLERLQSWVADERIAASRLVVVTRGAVAVSGEPVGSGHGAALGPGALGAVGAPGPVRPGRHRRRTRSPRPRSVPARGHRGAELALRDGALSVPRLATARSRPANAAPVWNPRGHGADHRRHRRPGRASPGTW